MAKEPSTSHLSFRIANRVRFAADFCSVITNEPITALIQGAITARADGVEFRGKRWEHYWDESEGVRWCNLWIHPEFRMESQERELVRAHRRFFYERGSKGAWRPSRQRIEVLWPHVTTLSEHWSKHRSLDPWATGEKMQTMLEKARIKPPSWGPNTKIDDDE